MIGAAENLPRAQWTFASPAGARITIATRVSLPRPPESSTPIKDAAREGGAAPSAIDTEVVLAKIHLVDDPRDSGARKLGPGVFVGTRGRELVGPG